MYDFHTLPNLLKSSLREKCLSGDLVGFSWRSPEVKVSHIFEVDRFYVRQLALLFYFFNVHMYSGATLYAGFISLNLDLVPLRQAVRQKAIHNNPPIMVVQK